jgi:hypothetical protein
MVEGQAVCSVPDRLCRDRLHHYHYAVRCRRNEAPCGEPVPALLEGKEGADYACADSFLAGGFLKGFSEAIGIAVVIVVAYIS